MSNKRKRRGTKTKRNDNSTRELECNLHNLTKLRQAHGDENVRVDDRTEQINGLEVHYVELREWRTVAAFVGKPEQCTCDESIPSP
jgi:hypothetical protein